MPISLRPRLLAAIMGVLLLSAGASATPVGRVEVDAGQYPWSAIGRVNLAGRGHCTGFLIGERHVMTAAHCLRSPRSGRWLAPSEIHFIAGYQREDYRLHSPVVGYRRSRLAPAKGEPEAADILSDWALLELQRPVGREAGWLGLQVLDDIALEQIREGEASLLQAGYRHGRTHVMTASFDCELEALFAGGAGLTHDCMVGHGDSGSPLLVLADGQFRAAGIHSATVERQGRRVAGVVTMQAFRRQPGGSDAAAALAEAGIGWGPSHPPAAASQ